ncbi:unnamed protein product [Parnassius apollo]|uniref:(apollo) hypothetical protein n=1 Tax=Parnassius apollo TaxID=110799 RepID=A0A8S3XLN2_PARAO|nr:unnamed protein product [Parnassius apollo]
MALLKLITFLCCTYIVFASQHTHIIPVENYDTELQELGQHVEYPETPVKVVKITKTIAVKVPVPYPVKVIQKVPYPVHVSKPYPVPVTQIVKVPHIVNVGSKDKGGHEALNVPSYQSNQQFGSNSYQVQENPSPEIGHGYNLISDHQSYGGSFGNSAGEEYSSDGSSEGSYGTSLNGYHGYPGNHDGANSFESNSYDEAIQNYLEKHGSNNAGSVPHY